MDETVWPLYASALATGLVFGFVLQRGGFCLTRAISNAALASDTTILRAYVLALLVAMAGVQVIVSLDLVDIPIRPLHWLSNIVGGALFGVGMILSGGCSGSTWYRIGEGAIGAWIILIGFAIGAGFAVIENLHYLSALPDRNVWLWSVRGFGTAILHGTTTAIVLITAKSMADRGRLP